MIEQLLSSEAIYALGWTLVHTFWQGALFALLLAVLLLLLRSYSAQARYLVSVGLLAGFFLTVVFTFTQLYQQADTAALSTSTQEELPVASDRVATAPLTQPIGQEPSSSTLSQVSAPPATISFQQRMTEYYNTHLPLIVTLWLMGVLVLVLRKLGQLAFVQRLKSYGTAHFPTEWMDRLRELETRLDMKRPVQYLLSRRIESPMTFGFLRPVVLFPATLIKELEDTQIYAILAHELAHIKRDDFLVNLIQQLLLTLFFYHPGLWWMSARIEEEREHACDDLAIHLTDQPLGYAKTLIQIKENQMNQMSMSMAFTGATASGKSGFQNRITRLLSNSLAKATYGEGFTTALILVMVLAIAIGATGPSPNQALVAAATSENASHLANATPDPQKGENTANSSVVMEMDDAADWGDPGNDFFGASDATFAATSLDDTFGEKSDFDLFMEAVDDGNLKLVEYFIEKGIDVNATDQRGITPLILAASEDHPEIIRLLLAKGAHVNYVNKAGISALAEAADEGSYASAIVLLEAGADVSLSGYDNGRTAVALAASEGHLQILELLLNAGADVKSKSGALQAAAEEGKIEVVAFLLKQGVDINQKDTHGRTALSYAAEEDQQKIVRMLLDRGADPGLKDERDRTALDYAANEDAAEVVAQLMATKSGKARARNNPHLLIEASDEGALAVVKQLVEAGADVNLRDEEGNTALMAAADEGEVLVGEYLIRQGAKVNAANLRGGWMALHFAASEDQTNMMVMLLRNGAKIEARCDFRSFNFDDQKKNKRSVTYYAGATPLLVAIEENNQEAVKVLLENKADPNIFVSKRKIILPNDFHWGDIENFDDKTAAQNLQPLYDTKSWTPLMEAVESEAYWIVDMLLEAGAKVDAQTEKGMTALSLAEQLGNSKIINRLKEN